MNDFREAGNKNKDDNKAIILGVGVNSTSASTVLAKISSLCSENGHTKPYFIITAYSENILESNNDMQLAKAFENADIVVPDGISAVAARDYLKRRNGRIRDDLRLGFSVGWNILKGKYSGQKVMGVELTRKILRTGGEKGWRIFLLGGWKDVGEKLAGMMRRDFPKITISGDPGPEHVGLGTDKELVRKINDFGPDVLLVAFGRFKQEKWIAANLRLLNARVVLGVGSSFDELTGTGPWAAATPRWVDRMGLKWLWRAVRNPGHLRRAWNAFPVFAWKVFRSRD
jgi:N-acetylglucosaminyldiphosphoundecaprenol N-acetyl-beta-D-mannosaminyltransferase